MFTKVIHPFDIKAGKLYQTRSVPVFCEISIKAEPKGRTLSITGVIGPTRSGNAAGGSGQIDMEFYGEKAYYKPSDLCLAPGWTRGMLTKLWEVWDRWHLNDMHSECQHQRALGWKYETRRGVWVEKAVKEPRFLIDEYATGEIELVEVFDPYKGHACPVCGYEIGSAWLLEKLPQEVVDFLASLPDTDKTPAWVRPCKV